jgi:hypothetical protein
MITLTLERRSLVHGDRNWSVDLEIAEAQLDDPLAIGQYICGVVDAIRPKGFSPLGGGSDRGPGLGPDPGEEKR